MTGTSGSQNSIQGPFGVWIRPPVQTRGGGPGGGLHSPKLKSIMGEICCLWRKWRRGDHLYGVAAQIDTVRGGSASALTPHISHLTVTERDFIQPSVLFLILYIRSPQPQHRAGASSQQGATSRTPRGSLNRGQSVFMRREYNLHVNICLILKIFDADVHFLSLSTSCLASNSAVHAARPVLCLGLSRVTLRTACCCGASACRDTTRRGGGRISAADLSRHVGSVRL